jgi:hypothetical protein
MKRPGHLSNWSLGSNLWSEDLFEEDGLPLTDQGPLTDLQLKKQYGWMEPFQTKQVHDAMQVMGRPLTIAEQKALMGRRNSALGE